MLPGSLTKKAEAENSRQYKADGYDLLVTSRADGAPRPPQGASEKHKDAKQVWQPAGDNSQQDNETPLQLQPERATIYQVARRRRQ